MKAIVLILLAVLFVACATPCATPVGQPKPEVPQAEQKAPAKK